MRTRAGIAGIIGAGLLGLVSTAQAYTSPYGSMAAAGTFNSWATTPNMTLMADNTWVGTQTLSAASGEFKFTANNAWANSWGGNASIARVPAGATAPAPGGGNLKFAGLTAGAYRFIFNDSTLEFRLEWAGASALPIPAITNLYVVGDFNGWTPSAASRLTNSPAATNVWSGSITLETPTSFQFQPNGNAADQWGAPEDTALAVPVTNGSACGKSAFALSFEPGTFLFTLNASNATFAVSQTVTQSFALSTMTVQGNFIATNKPPANMTKLSDTAWESDHHITNNGTITLRFASTNSIQYWGATNGTPVYALPATGAVVATRTNYAQVSGVSTGRYRIAFNHQTGAFSFRRLYTEASGVNLLKNAGFEKTTLPGGGDASDWGSWQSWPKSVADGFAPHSGNWVGAIHGKFDSTRTDYASFAQDVLVSTGSTYRASAWFMATPDWTAASMQIKIEWRNILGVPVGYDDVVNIPALGTNWVKYAVEGVAPDGASLAHVVFLCAGAGETGKMLVDDAEMRAVASRTQDFETWGALTTFTNFAPDWSVTSGRVMWNVSPGQPPGEVFISQYVEGTGKNKAVEIFNGTLSNLDLAAQGFTLRQYDNGSTTASVSMALSGSLQPGTCLVVARPSFPTNYAPDLAIVGLPGVWTNKALTFNGDDVLVLLKGTNVMDRVGQVGTNAPNSIWSLGTRNHTLVRKSTVYTGTLSAVTAPFSLLDGWEAQNNDSFDGLGRHELSYDDPNEPYKPAGYSLVMGAGATLTSGDLSGGIGDVSFWWRTESTGPAITLVVETAASDAGPWTNAATLSGVTASNFTYFVASVNRSEHPYVRFRQTDGGTNRFRIDEIFVSAYSAVKRAEDFNAWTDPAYAVSGNFTRYGWAIQSASIDTGGVFSSRAAFLAPPYGKVISPTYEDGVGEVLFWAKAASSNEPAYLLLQTSIDGGSNWTTRGSFTATHVPKTFTTWLYLTNASQARIAFDTGFSSGDVFVDNVEVHLPALYRYQNFNAWPTRNANTNESIRGWAITNCIVNATNAYSGNAARLGDTIGSFVRSPDIPDGLGTISFKTRQWNADDNATIAVQLSPNGSSWTTLASVTPASTSYESFSYYMQDTTNRYVRFYHSAGSAISLLDEIRIEALQPRPEVIVTPGLSPDAPATNDSMLVTADVISRYGAAIVSVTGIYQVASITPVPVAMAPVAYGSYASVSSIPPQTSNKRIRYHVRVQYAGIGAVPGSTGMSTNLYISSTGTVFVSSVQKGDVWINEISYLSMEDVARMEHAEYIELCGAAGSAIGGWTIRLLFGADADIATNGGPIYASYQIPPGTVLANQTNGHGFYVLGDQQLIDAGQPVDQALTTLVPAPPLLFNVKSNHIHNSRGVIQLLNEHTNRVYTLSYAGYASGADNIPAQQVNLETNSVSLTGIGFSYDQFTPWATTSNLTIGAVNDGQTLEEEGGGGLAIVWHIPEELVVPVNPSVPAFYLRDPAHAQSKSNLLVHYGFSSTNYTLPGGTLHHRKIGESWSNFSMSSLTGSRDADSNDYVRGTIPLRTYSRGSSIEYVIEANAGSGTDATFIGADATNDFALFATLADAQDHPFVYTYEVHPEIVITNMATNSTSWILYTAGNEPPGLEPFTSFKVYISSNLLSTGYGYTTGFVATNVWTNNPIWVTNAFTNSAVDDFGQNVFVIPKTAARVRFYRIHALW